MPLIRNTSQNIKLRPAPGLGTVTPPNPQNIATTKAVSLKNQITELSSLDDIADVTEEEKEDGAVPVWNSTTNKYEVRILTLGDTDEDIDGGEF